MKSLLVETSAASPAVAEETVETALRQQVEDELTGLHQAAKRYETLGPQYTERVAPLLAAVRELI